ncbi:MAG: murein biosynthesis integral membrane protein MurJ [Actinomycetaceae bacterium]|nr:murein biosynthesis integral membrane protein MurJ [Actinomycetaceae bacterium]
MTSPDPGAEANKLGLEPLSGGLEPDLHFEGLPANEQSPQDSPEEPTPSNDDDLEPVGDPRSGSMLRSSAVMAAGTLVSRILGFLRWALLLIAIGGVGANDAFQVANTLPNAVFNLLAAGLLDAILVPQIVRALKTRSGSVYVNRLLTLAGLILFGLTILMLACASLLVTISAAQMAPEWKNLAVIFAWWCLPQIFFYGLYALLGEFLNARGIFGPYMWTPVANNIVGIAGILLYIAVYGTATDISDPSLWDFQRTAILAGPATLGVIVQALLLFIPLRKAGVKLRLDFHFRGTGLRSASTVTGWVFATLLVGQVGTLSTSNIAGAANQWWQDTGVFAPSNAALSYAFMVYMLPQSIISVSIATAIFTRMASAAADKDHQLLVQQYYYGVRSTLLLVMWLTAVLGAGAIPVFQALGPNNPVEHMVGYAQVLVATLPGMIGACVVLFSQRVFYAIENARPVFLTILFPTIGQIILGWTLKAFLPATMWLSGAMFAEALSRLAQGVIAVYLIHQVFKQVQPRHMIGHMVRYGLFALVSGAVGYGALKLVGTVHQGEGALENFLGAAARGFLVFVVVTIVYFLIVVIFDRETTQLVMSILSRRIPALARFAGEEDEDHEGAQTEVSAGVDIPVSDDAPDTAGPHPDGDVPTATKTPAARPTGGRRSQPVAPALAHSQVLHDLQSPHTATSEETQTGERPRTDAEQVMNPHWHEVPTATFDDLVLGTHAREDDPEVS